MEHGLFLMSLPQGPHLNSVSWPSLYNPAIEVAFLGQPARQGGYYLSDPDDIFKFTLYWTLIFHIPFSFVAGLYAFFNLAFPPARTGGKTIVLAPFSTTPRAHSYSHSYSRSGHSRSGSHSHSHAGMPFGPPQTVDVWPKPPRLNARRSRWAFALLVFLVFIVFSLVSAVVGATVVAFVLVGVYRAGGFYMSTWIPFIWAVIQSLIALLEIWPSIIDII